MVSLRAPRTLLAAMLVFALAPGASGQATRAAGEHLVRVRGVVDGSAIVETARRYLGVRYVLGGTTPKAFDCSGFVRYVFAQHGLAFPRTAHEQAALGRAPEPGELEPGDLLFFYGGRGAQHIAIYIGGDSIIHASSSGHRVKLDRLPGRAARRSWFGQRLIAVRRVLPADGTIDLPQSLAVPEPEIALPGDSRSPGPALPMIF